MARDKRGVTTPEETLGTSLFLGTLRSEFDTEEELAPAWTALMGVAEEVRMAYSKGEITGHEAAVALSSLRLKDRTGSEWTVGASSGEWYRRLSGAMGWVRSAPPVVVEAVPEGQAWIEGGYESLFPKKTPNPDAVPVETQEADGWAESASTQLSELPVEYHPPVFGQEGTQEWVAPVPRANSVSAADVLGWQPIKREDGPQLPPVADSEPAPEVDRAEPVFDYSQALDAFISDQEKGSEQKEAPSSTAGEVPTQDQDFEEDFFDLPSDLFYRPDED